MVTPFAEARAQLEKQYVEVPYDRESGLSREALVAEFDAHRADHADEPRILTRAWLLHLLCSKGRIAAEPHDYFGDKLEHHNMLVALREQWRREEDGREFGGDEPALSGSWYGSLDAGHTCPDWRELLREGFTGLRDRALARRDGAAAGQEAFYQAVALVYEGAATLARRLAEALPEEAPARPVLEALSQRPPQTLHEALQLAYLYHQLHEMENGYSVRSMGRFEVLYGDFYTADLEAGRLTREQAKELLKYFWIKFYAQHQGRMYGKPFLFGPGANDFSRLAFEVYREMNVVDPKLHVRLGKDTPADFVRQVFECIRGGCTGIVLANYEAQVPMLCANGKALEDAEDYILIGCYEPAVMGKELNCSGACAVNLARAVEQVLEQAEYGSFEELLTAYLGVLDDWIGRAIDRVRREERLWPQISPSPVLSGTMPSCLERGKDVSEAGARYNTSGLLSAGLANAIDSLAVIRQFVFEEQRCTQRELRAALAANWEGYEELRLTAQHRVPKWGNNDPRVDELGRRLTDFLGARINTEPNSRGGVFQAALYTITDTAKNLGSRTGALPDGRRDGEPLTINTGATVGRDRSGVTSLINSVTSLQLSQFPNGTVLDIMLHPSVVRGEQGLATLEAIVRSHFAQGGMAIQFNIFDAGLLREAQRNPEKYANLQVRVCGWNARFIDLAPEEQEMYIQKAEVA